VSERTFRAYERWAATYDTDPNPQIALEEEAVLHEVSCESGIAVLDAGCGTGRYSGCFFGLGAHVVGIDFSPEMLRRARQKNPAIPFVLADLESALPFRGESFDRVNCAQTLKHLPSLATAMKEFARVLRPRGHLVFSVTHPEMTWEGYEMQNTPAFILSAEADIHHHQLSDYRAAIAAAGLTLDRILSVPVDERIRTLLTPASFDTVRGRNQIAVFRASKSRAPGSSAGQTIVGARPEPASPQARPHGTPNSSQPRGEPAVYPRAVRSPKSRAMGFLATLVVLQACSSGSTEDRAGQIAPDSAFDPVQVQVAGAWRQHIDAAQRKDTIAISRIYAPDVVYVLPSGDEVRGWAAVDSFEVAGLSRTDVISAQHQTTALMVSDRMAYELGTITGSVQSQGQAAVAMTYRFMAMWERQDDGSWRIRYLVGS